MNGINIFLSYARSNTAAAVDLERALEDVGVSVWRDQAKLYAGARWPKDLGEAVAGNDALVLVWTESAAASKFVELEWCTALALGKPVLPYLIDGTPLPPVLASFHGLEADDASKDAPRLVERLRSQPETAVGGSRWLLTALEDIEASDPEAAYQTVRNLLTTAAATTTGQSIDLHGGPPSPFTPGTVIGDRYEIKTLLGKGGMGEVWRAFDLKIRVDVALKVLHGATDEKALEVLRREVRTARDVASSNVCRIYDLGEADGVEFLSMEYVDGKTLAQIMAEEGPLKVDEASPLASQMLSGLQAIHEAGLVHRDIKPENLMVTRTGRVVVMDLGLARWRTDDAVFSVSGTPAYMAPEQLLGDKVDARCDVYAAGVVLAELTCPDGARDLAQRQAVWTGIQQQPPKLPDTPWSTVLTKAVAKDSSDRFPSAQALARALEKETVKTVSDREASPYPGLAAFTEADAEFFFGREAEVENLWKKLQGEPRLLAVVGPSGVGKSSFLQAGVLGARPEGWATMRVTPGSSPFVVLGQALARRLSDDGGVAEQMVRFSEPDVAVELINRWAKTGEHALLMVDQFEELFTQNPAEVQTQFAEVLGRLPIEADAHVLLGMRDDFLYHCHAHESLSPILSELTLLGPPTGEGLRRAIVQPALKCGFRFEDEALVDEMLDEVEGERGALPLLAFACAQLWEKRDKEHGLLTRSVYENIGGVAGALAGHAEATLDRIGQDRLPLVREIFRNLVTADGTRAERDRDELLSVFPEKDRAAAAEVLDALIDARLLVSYEEEAEEEERHRIEIIHESLLASWPRLVRWQTQDADAAQMRDQLRQAAKMWEDRNRAEDLLWSGKAYREFDVWRENYPGRLSDNEQAFAAAMTARATRQRRQRRLAGAAIIVLALAIAGATSLLWQRSEEARQFASDEALRAEASKLLAIAELRREKDPTEALAYTTASLGLSDSEEARVFSQRLLLESPPARELAAGQQSRFPAFSPDGRRLAVMGHAVEGRVWNAQGGPPLVLSGHVPSSRGGNRAVWLSDRLLVTGHPVVTDQLYVWEFPGGERVRTLDYPPGRIRWQPGQEMLLAKIQEDVPGGDDWRWRLGAWHLPDWEYQDLGTASQESRPDARFVDRDLFLPNGRGWLYAEGDAVYLRPLPSEDSGQADRLIGRHETKLTEMGFVSRAPFRIYSLDESGEIRIWAFPQGLPKLLKVIPPPAHKAVQRVPDPSLRWALGDFWATQGRQARLWNLGAWREARPLVLKRDVDWFGAAPELHPFGKWLVVSTSRYSRLTLWPLLDSWPIVVDGYDRIIRPVAFSPDGRWLATNWTDGDIRLWPLPGNEEQEIRSLGLSSEPNLWMNLAFDPQGRFIFVVGLEDQAFVVPLDGSPARQLDAFSPDTMLLAAAVSPSGRRVATAPAGGGERTLRIWDLEADSLRTYDLPADADATSDAQPRGGILSVAFTDESTLYTAGAGGVRHWDLETGKHRVVFATRPGYWAQMDLSPDGRKAVVRERPPAWKIEPSDLHLLELDTGQVQDLGSFTACIGSTPSVRISDSVIAGDCEGELRVGSVKGGEPHLLPGHDGPVQFVAISPDERWIASTGDDSTLRLWPMPDLDKPPLHTLPRDELIAKLKSLTNIRVVRDPDSEDGWKVELDEFPGWAEVPEW